MPLNTLGLVAGIAVARREGVEQSQVPRVALPGAIFPNLALGVIIVERLAKQEAAAEAAKAAAATGGTVGPGAGASQASGSRGSGTPGSNGGGTAGGTLPILAPLPQPRSYPTVVEVVPASTFSVGDTLKADTGSWQGVGSVALQFQWFRDQVELKGQNDPEYTIQAADDDHHLAVEVCCVGTGGEAVITRSPWIPIGDPKREPPTP